MEKKLLLAPSMGCCDLYDFENQRVITPEYDTAWQDELYRNAPSQRHHISVNGGTDKIRYEVSAAYQNQERIILSTGQRRLHLRGNLDIQVILCICERRILYAELCVVLFGQE